MKRVRGMYSKDLKNRSSKHLYFAGLLGPGTKPAVWSMSNDALKEFIAKLGPKAKGNIFEKELERRARNRAKRNKA